MLLCYKYGVKVFVDVFQAPCKVFDREATPGEFDIRGDIPSINQHKLCGGVCARALTRHIYAVLEFDSICIFSTRQSRLATGACATDLGYQP